MASDFSKVKIIKFQSVDIMIKILKEDLADFLQKGKGQECEIPREPF